MGEIVTANRTHFEAWADLARRSGLDVIVHAQEPKITPHKTAIRVNLARILGLEPTAVNVKAKTGERVGHIGRAEALACQAVVLIDRSNP